MFGDPVRMLVPMDQGFGTRPLRAVPGRFSGMPMLHESMRPHQEQLRYQSNGKEEKSGEKPTARHSPIVAHLACKVKLEASSHLCEERGCSIDC